MTGSRNVTEIEEQLSRVEQDMENADEDSEYHAILRGQAIALRWVIDDA